VKAYDDARASSVSASSVEADDPVSRSGGAVATTHKAAIELLSGNDDDDDADIDVPARRTLRRAPTNTIANEKTNTNIINAPDRPSVSPPPVMLRAGPGADDANLAASAASERQTEVSEMNE